MSKKFLLLLLIFVLLFAITACNNEEEIESGVTIIEGEEIGGFIDVEDGTLTDELIALFEEAEASWNGIPMEPLKLLQTQVVAGTNYKFLAKEVINTLDGVRETYKEVVIYEDLDGSLTISYIEDYTGELE